MPVGINPILQESHAVNASVFYGEHVQAREASAKDSFGTSNQKSTNIAHDRVDRTD
jgi:hypothetical protein